MAMVFLTDRKLDNSNINNSNNNSSSFKDNAKVSTSQSNMNIDNMISIPKIKVPFNSQSKGTI